MTELPKPTKAAIYTLYVLLFLATWGLVDIIKLITSLFAR